MTLLLSLFPGIGLLDMAFEEAGFCVVRGPDVLWGGDVRGFHPPTGVFDGVIGGPPCQTFSSLANLVRAKGHEPRFGNLIPEFERCVGEAAPRWFLMENVPAAPVPVVDGYAVTDFMLCNSWLDAGDGMGEEQERKRRFSFGVRGDEAVDLRRWIKPAALLLPRVHGAVTAELGGAKGRARTRSRKSAVLADQRETPVKLGGSGKVKRSRRPTVVAGHDDPPGQRRKTSEVLRERQAAITGRISGEARPERTKHGARGERRTLAEMCRLQGLPEDLLDDAPFTMDGKRKAIANGVPLPMGRAIAQAVRSALDQSTAPSGEDSP